jgi:hypothetical protein
MNGVYILQTTDGYRVAYSTEYESMLGSYDANNMRHKLNGEIVNRVFGECFCFVNYLEAQTAARMLSVQYQYLDDGIYTIREVADQTYEEVIND